MSIIQWTNGFTILSSLSFVFIGQFIWSAYAMAEFNLPGDHDPKQVRCVKLYLTIETITFLLFSAIVQAFNPSLNESKDSISRARTDTVAILSLIVPTFMVARITWAFISIPRKLSKLGIYDTY